MNFLILILSGFSFDFLVSIKISLNRMWEFSVGLYMIDIWPDSLLFTAIYGVVESASTAIFGPFVGKLVDRLTYVQVKFNNFNSNGNKKGQMWMLNTNFPSLVLMQFLSTGTSSFKQ